MNTDTISPSHELTDWENYCRLVSSDRGGQRITSQQIGFQADGSEIARFAYRFRLAGSFRGLNFDGYKQETVRGHEALFRLFLVYSAFERFMPIVGFDTNTVSKLLDSHDGDDCIARFKAADTSDGLLTFLAEKVENKQLKVQLNYALKGRAISPERLGAAARHIYAHGYLTPYDGGDLEVGGEPEVAATACAVVSEFLMNVMNCEFSQIIGKFTRTIR